MSKKTQKNVDRENFEKCEEEKEELQEMIKELAESIDKVEDEKLVLSNQLKKALADYQNLEVNSARRVNIMYQQSRKSLAEKLIPLVDDMTMALKVKDEIEFSEKASSWASGVEGIFNNLERSLDEIGVKKYIPEKDSKFDPSIHEALTVVEGKEGGLIFDVIQPGYILDDVIIRPARVVVTKK